MSAPVFRAEVAELRDAVVGAGVRLGGAEGHHAATVRRLTAGERVDLVDGAGRRVAGRVATAGRDGLSVTVDEVLDEPRPSPRMIVVQALPKGERAELAVEMLTEVGVDAVVAWQASRSVVQWRGERAAKSLSRWQAVAREAAKQSRRAWVPEVTGPATTADVAALLAGSALGCVLHEAADVALADQVLPEAGDIVLVVGPEGGINDAELAAFSGAGARTTRLGPSVLRTSSAGAVAAAVVLSRTSRWSLPEG